MNDIVIKRHSFDLAKKRLKEFSEKTEAQLAIDKVRTDGGFLGLGNHKVTGYELNERLECIQGHLIDINSTNNKTIKEFREVYNALDALDKDYITSIVNSVKAIEKTSNDVRVQQGTLKQHNEKLLNQQNKLDAHQVEIEKNVANITKVVTVLKSFKEKLDGYKHLTDIDKIWSDCKTIRNEIQIVSDSITMLSKKTTTDIATANNQNKALVEQVNKDIFTLRNEAKSFREFFSDLSDKIEATSELLDNQVPIIQDISNFVNEISNVNHLNDVDTMWEEISGAKESFDSIKKELQNIDADILQIQSHFDDLDAFVTVLNSYTHLHDIDSIWGDLVDIKIKVKEIINNINDSKEEIQKHQSNLENLNATSAEHKESIDALFHKQVEAEEYTRINRNSITELQAFRGKVDSIEHLSDVDSMWKQGNKLQTDLAEAKEKAKADTEKLINDMEKINRNIDEHQNLISILNAASDEHKKSIDTMSQKQTETERYAKINRAFITELQAFRGKVDSIEHISDVDFMWEQGNALLTDLTEVNNSIVCLQQKIIETDNEMVDRNVKVEGELDTLERKLKYAYFIAGGSLGLAVIELILILTGVI
ncbi:MAG: hypothetical protein SPK49_08200 [Erysipelotrichaceae bacterium]|nr:hypothetical protein [Erysipelotrichaceae bacterium]